MNKIKQVFSHNDERETSPRDSLNSAYENSTSAAQSTASKKWALGVVGNQTGDEATGATGGAGVVTGASDRLSSGSTGLGNSTIDRDTSGLGLATGAGTTRGLDARAGDSVYTDRKTSGTAATHDILPPGRGPGTTGLGGNETLTGRDSTTTGTRAVSGASLTGTGDSTTTRGVAGAGKTGLLAGVAEKLTHSHSVGHDSRDTTKFDPRGPNTEHDHQHLQAVTHESHRHIEVEEVERQREQHRHIHHVQHHVQPIHHTEIRDEVLHQNIVPETKIHERHVNSEDDVKLFHSLGAKHRNEEKHLAKERTVVDLGEKVNTVTHHHVHHVTQPVLEREVHNKHRIHTVIPISHTIHEAPIVHKSSIHEPVRLEEFLKGGGKLDSGITHAEAGVLSVGDCDRQVDGEAETLISKLNLNPLSSHAHTHGTATTGTTAGTTTARVST